MSSESSPQEEDHKSFIQRRERERTSQITSEFQKLLSILPEPNDDRTRVSRLDVLKNATSYIESLSSYLKMENTDGIDARAMFPHAFDSNYDNHVRLYTRNAAPSKPESSCAQSSHDEPIPNSANSAPNQSNSTDNTIELLNTVETAATGNMESVLAEQERPNEMFMTIPQNGEYRQVHPSYQFSPPIVPNNQSSTTNQMNPYADFETDFFSNNPTPSDFQK